MLPTGGAMKQRCQSSVSQRECRTKIRAVFVSFLVFLNATNACGTTLRKLSLEDMVSAANSIVVGECTETRTEWLAKKIYTIASVRIEQCVKGEESPGEKIEVYILGGRVREPIPIKMHVPGAAQIASGEEMVLFLQKRSFTTRAGQKGYYRIVGMAQGKVPVSTDPKTGQKSAHYPEPIKGVKKCCTCANAMISTCCDRIWNSKTSTRSLCAKRIWDRKSRGLRMSGKRAESSRPNSPCKSDNSRRPTTSRD